MIRISMWGRLLAVVFGNIGNSVGMISMSEKCFVLENELSSAQVIRTLQRRNLNMEIYYLPNLIHMSEAQKAVIDDKLSFSRHIHLQ